MRFRLPLVPTLLTALMLPVLVGLGLWQATRIEPKTRFIAAVEAASSAAPVPLPTTPDPDKWQFRRVTISGRFDHKGERLLYRPSGRGEPGYHVLTPLVRDQGPAIIVDRGWIPEQAKEDAGRLAARPTESVVISGFARTTEEGNWLGRSARLSDGLYSRVDLDLISDDLGRPLAPLFISSDISPADIPNNHLSYAVQWFFFAATLLTIYIIYVRRWRREQADSSVAAGQDRR